MHTDASSSPAERVAGRAVVIGGSAGALDALLRLVAGLPRDWDAAVIVVVHMPPHGESALAAALAPVSVLPVCEPLDKQPVEPGVVYLASPGYHLLVEPGPRFAFSVDEPVHFAQPSIDVLFASAADVFGADLVGVVLSGANDDGADGLAAVVRAGGTAVVQAPEEAAHGAMPRCALAAVPAALALPGAEIARRLAADTLHLAALQTP